MKEIIEYEGELLSIMGTLSINGYYYYIVKHEDKICYMQKTRKEGKTIYEPAEPILFTNKHFSDTITSLIERFTKNSGVLISKHTLRCSKKNRQRAEKEMKELSFELKEKLQEDFFDNSKTSVLS